MVPEEEEEDVNVSSDITVGLEDKNVLICAETNEWA